MQTESELLNKFLSKLNELDDARRTVGQRHSQAFVIMIVLFATMSGYIGYRAIGAFIKKHSKELVKILKPNKARVPSYSTVRRILMQLDPENFQHIYGEWLEEVRLLSKETEVENKEENRWYSIDGKAIRGANQMSKDDYTHLVSIFSNFKKIVVDSKKVQQKSNEIPCVQQMIEKSNLQGVIFTLDALHGQKKR